MLNLPTPVGVEHYAGIVKRDATYRKMISVAMNIAQVAYQGGADLDEALAKAEQLVYALRTGGKSGDFVHIREYLDPYLDPPDAATSSRPTAATSAPASATSTSCWAGSTRPT